MKYLKGFLKVLSVAAFSISFAIPQVYAAGVLGVTQITATQTFAEANNTYENGWRWVFDITVPDNEPILKMRFADWTNGSNVIPVANNVKIYSEQSSNAYDLNSALILTGSGFYSDEMNLLVGTDLDVTRAGKQIQVTVATRIPTGSVGGSYSTSYGLSSAADTQAPTITLQGVNSVTVEAGTSYVDAGATAFDNIDLIVVPTSTSTVNTATPGTYSVTYTATDSALNSTSTARTVTVVDTTAPTISTSGDVKVKSTGTTTLVTLPDPTVTDAGDPAPVVSNDAPESYSVGTTTVTWTATDASGNTASTTQRVIVSDSTGPVITLNGSSMVNLQVYDTYTEEGVVVTDNIDTNLTASTTGEVDTGVVGTYTVTYTAVDSDYNHATTTRTVIVNPIEVSVTLNAENKGYNGNTDANVSCEIQGVSEVTCSASNGKFEDKNAGDSKMVSADISLEGEKKDNYILASDTATTSANITKRAITVSAVTDTKVYDTGTTSAALPIITTGSLAADDEANFIQYYEEKNAGTEKKLIPSGTVNDDNNGENYDVTFIDNDTGIIEKASVGVVLWPQHDVIQDHYNAEGEVIGMTHEEHLMAQGYYDEAATQPMPGTYMYNFAAGWSVNDPAGTQLSWSVRFIPEDEVNYNSYEKWIYPMVVPADPPLEPIPSNP